MVWIVRLVLYPAAIALIAGALHKRSAEAEPARESPIAFFATQVASTDQGHELKAATVGDRARWLRVPVDLRCPSGLANLAITIEQRMGGAPRDVVAGATLRARRDGLVFGWRDGSSVRVATRLQATFHGASARGTLWVSAVVAPFGRPAVTCRSGAVRFTPGALYPNLKRWAGPVLADRVLVTGPALLHVDFAGRTGDGGAATATAAGGELRTLRAWHRLTCVSPTGARVRARGWFWTDVTAFAQGRDDRLFASWGPGTPYRWQGHPDATASMRLRGRLDAMSLRGTLSVAVRPRGDAGPATCRATDVPFTLRARPAAGR
jgi:hypothetical protein